jgi:hypothetical protein
MFTPTPDQVAAGFAAGIRFTVTRNEDVALRNGVVVRRTSYVPPSPAMLQ